MRKLGLLITLWTALLFFPLSSFALGLGEIEVSTFLNQPLKAEIEVLSARPGEVDDLLVSLASRDAFRKAGLQRPSNLSKLRFKVEKSEDGQSARILISTKTPVKEPFLNFLVEADWAKGRLLREFTILLDPPYFSQQAEPQVAAPAGASFDTQQQAPTEDPMAAMQESMQQPTEIEQMDDTEPLSQPIALSDEPPEDEEPVPFIADNTFLDGDAASEDIVVQKGDTLWGIASRFKDDEHSMAQVMLAMQAMNPDAFSQNNINNLKVGAVLRAPDLDTIGSLSKQEAYAQVLEQNGLWDEYVARKSGATTAGSPEDVLQEQMLEPQEETDGQLSLLAPGDGESTSASLQNEANIEDAGQIRKQLALAEEELEASRLQNDDLKSRIADLEQQLSKFEELQKLVQIQDDSMAQLQGQVAEEAETAVVMEEPESEPEAEMQAEVESELQDQSAAPDMGGFVEEQPSDVMKEAADEMLAEQTDDQMMADTMSDQESPLTEPADDMQEQSSEAETILDTMPQSEEMVTVEGPEQAQEQEGTFVPAPVIVTETPAAMDGGIMDMLPSLDSLLGDPVMLGGFGAILLLILGFLFLKRKKADEEDESAMLLDDGDDLLDDDATPIHVPTAEDAELAEEEIDSFAIADTEQHMADTEQHLADTLAVEADEIADVGEVEDKFGTTEVIDAEVTPTAEEAVADEQDDVLNEVDVYLAYGLYDNAEDLLKESLQDSPDRADYRAKLLDTYFATKNAGGFIQEAEALKSLGGAADRYWDRVQIMGFELAPENDLFADARNSDLSVADLEYTKPETPDFDIGAEDDITDFSNTDFDLGAETDTFDVTSDLIDTSVDIDDLDKVPDTQTIAPVGGIEDEPDDVEDEDLVLTGLEDEEETQIREEEIEKTDNLELPDEIGDFDIDLGDSDEQVEDNVDEDALNFDLPDDLDLSVDLEPSAEVEQLKDQAPEDQTDVELDLEASDEVEIALDDSVSREDEEQAKVDSAEVSQTVVMPTGNEEDTSEVSQTMVMAPGDDEEKESDDVEGTRHIEAALDMDMSDLDSADLNTGTFKPAGEDDITEFSPAEITGEFTAFEDDSDAALEEVDTSEGLDKTGTYAPGDFNDDELDGAVDLAAGADDIEDLMLPDDVDEVGTKLDLAKAFIDMGDAEGAKSSLEEVLSEGTVEQKAEATDLLEKIK